jgi:tetratricopeptide (TPR) repeat protein
MGLGDGSAADADVLVEGYEVLGKLGEGGMGEVYLAVSEVLGSRTVAIKVVKVGMDTRALIARFQAERGALAMMDHPNIAGVYDAGETFSGRPFFAMEWVDGKPIDTFCRESGAGLRERLEFIVDAAAGIQHAHSKGVVHCDLKPSNILVAQSDGAVVPKVIDFGVAQAIDPEAKSGLTLAVGSGAQVFGTPAYMAPEQAGGEAKDVDTRADVYSLGAVLYELLAGVAPFAGEDQNSGLTQVLRQVREDAPKRPGVRAMEEGGSTMKIPVDLDWIVLRAMEKDRERRYASAGQFADDIRRFLSDQPVSARPPSRTYLFGKFARRHRFGLAIGGAVGILLSVATAVSLVQASRAHSAELVAVERREQSEKLVNFMLQDQYGQLKNIGYLELLEGVAEVAIGYYESLPEGMGETALIGYSSALAKIAETRFQKGVVEESFAAAEKAYQILEQAALQPGASDDLLFEFAQRCALLGVNIRHRDGPAASMPMMQMAIDVIGPLVEREGDTDASYQGYLAGFYAIEASNNMLIRPANPERALDLLKMAVEIRERLCAAHPESMVRRSDLADSYAGIARVHRQQGNVDVATELLERAVSIRIEVRIKRPLEVRWSAQLAYAYTAIARHYRDIEAYQKALAAIDSGIDIWHDLQVHQAENMDWLSACATALRVRSSIGMRSGDVADFETSATEAVKLWATIVDSAPSLDDRLQSMQSKSDLARILKTGLKYDRAAKLFEAVREDCKALRESGDADLERVMRWIDKDDNYAVQELLRIRKRQSLE